MELEDLVPTLEDVLIMIEDKNYSDAARLLGDLIDEIKPGIN